MIPPPDKEPTTPPLIPKEKLVGQRFGQAIYNALGRRYEPSEASVGHRLFYIENDELETLLRAHLNL